jgi:hypothetical protein
MRYKHYREEKVSNVCRYKNYILRTAARANREINKLDDKTFI